MFCHVYTRMHVSLMTKQVILVQFFEKNIQVTKDNKMRLNGLVALIYKTLLGE